MTKRIRCIMADYILQDDGTMDCVWLGDLSVRRGCEYCMKYLEFKTTVKDESWKSAGQAAHAKHADWPGEWVSVWTYKDSNGSLVGYECQDELFKSLHEIEAAGWELIYSYCPSGKEIYRREDKEVNCNIKDCLLNDENGACGFTEDDTKNPSLREYAEEAVKLGCKNEALKKALVDLKNNETKGKILPAPTCGECEGHGLKYGSCTTSHSVYYNTVRKLEDEPCAAFERKDSVGLEDIEDTEAANSSNTIILRENNLPDTLKDLSKFVLVGREKLTSVRAEIRAIDKLNLAEEVRNQKKDEAQMLSEALLDAEVRLGDLLKVIPKASGGDRKSDNFKKVTTEHFENSIKSKEQITKELGFDQNQVKRFETLSNNKDLVEHVKAEARENDDLPTRSRVLDLAKQRKQKEQEQAQQDSSYNEYIDSCKKIAVRFSNTIAQVQSLDTDDSSLKAWSELLDTTMLESERQKADEALAKIIKIQKFLKGVKL